MLPTLDLLISFDLILRSIVAPKDNDFQKHGVFCLARRRSTKTLTTKNLAHWHNLAKGPQKITENLAYPRYVRWTLLKTKIDAQEVSVERSRVSVLES